MEEEKLLCFLIKAVSCCITIVFVFRSFGFADVKPIESKVETLSSFSFKEEDIEFADKLRNKAVSYTTDEIIAKYKELKILEGRNEEGIEFEEMYKHKKTRPRLSVFVSSSMPIASLKAFSKQAVKYGATLVFKGLPGNSFQELIDLVSKINAQGEEGSIQLDDEAFAKFGVTKVPTIVLVEEKSCREFQTCIGSFDKVEGNISIMAALEMFATDGDTQGKAKEIPGR